MTSKVNIKITVDGQLYGGTYAFSKSLAYSEKTMIMKAIESLKAKLDIEMKEEKIND